MERYFRFNITTYGCQMNAHDSSVMAELLAAMGGEEADYADADVLIFNTCCVREHAEDKVFGNVGAIRKRFDEKKALVVGVVGCMMQQAGAAEAFMKRFPFVSFTMGTNNLHELPEVLRAAFSGRRVCEISAHSADVTLELPCAFAGVCSYVNVMYGCDNFCTYCIVPYVRGRERSRAADDVVSEVRHLSARGTREVTLLGQNVNSYMGGGSRFAELLRRVADETDILRIRFMTSHPKDISEDLMRAMADTPKVCRQLHLPLQSGSDGVLARMNRRYTAAQYLDIVRRLRERMPDIALSTDIIVGFPGETEDDFQKTLELARAAGFVTGYYFKYSPRTGTAAAKMPDQIPEDVKSERLGRLLERQNAATDAYNASLIGKTLDVMPERAAGRYPDEVIGRAENGRTVHFAAGPETVGAVVPARVTAVTGNTLAAQRIGTE